MRYWHDGPGLLLAARWVRGAEPGKAGGGNAADEGCGGSAASSGGSSLGSAIKLDRSTSLLSRNLASKVGAAVGFFFQSLFSERPCALLDGLLHGIHWWAVVASVSAGPLARPACAASLRAAPTLCAGIPHRLGSRIIAAHLSTAALRAALRMQANLARAPARGDDADKVTSLAAKLQSAVLSSMLSEEQPPIRRVKMVGHPLKVAPVSALVAV